MKTDIDIASEVKLKHIDEIAGTLGLKPEDLEHYGEFKAKIKMPVVEEVGKRNRGKLILVSAITPTPAGEGKTTVL